MASTYPLQPTGFAPTGRPPTFPRQPLSPYPRRTRPRRPGGRPPGGRPPGGPPRGPTRLPPNFTPPKPHNDNFPLKKFPLVRGLGRAVPYLGLALSLWELYLAYQHFLPGGAASGWTVYKTCNGTGAHWRKAGSAIHPNMSSCTDWNTFETAFPETPPFSIPDTPRPYYVEQWEKGPKVFSTIFTFHPGTAYEYAGSETGVTFEVPSSGATIPLGPPVTAPYRFDEVPFLQPQPEAQPLRQPITTPPFVPEPLPLLYPQPNPWSYPLPGLAPAPTPLPTPWPGVPFLPNFNPYLEPLRGPVPTTPLRPDPYRPYVQPDIETVPLPAFAPTALPTLPQPSVIPYFPYPVTSPVPFPYPQPASPATVPTTVVTFPTFGPPNITVTTDLILNEKTKRERKVRLNQAGKVVWRVASVTGEACDSIDAFYEAIPFNIRKQYQRKLARYGNYTNWLAYLKNQQDPNRRYYKEREWGLGCDQRAALVYKHFKRVDLEKAFKNLWNNYLQDRLLGKLSKGAADFGFKNIDSRRPVSIVTGGAL